MRSFFRNDRLERHFVPIFTTFVELRPRVLWCRWSAALLLMDCLV
jgi:hypothetical protein